jgi:hypothetical protein
VREFLEDGFVRRNVWGVVGGVGQEDAEVKDEFVPGIVWAF